MPSYERETRIDAPLENVWAFHSRVEGLETLTPAWMGLRVESVVGPDGEPNPDRLEAGSEIDLSIRPFGVGPRRRWTSIITERERDDGTAYFRDEMVRGPFDRWVHTHAFYADGDRTVLHDHVDYELPLSGTLGGVSSAAAPISQAGFEAVFRRRHRTTKAELE
ncbi:SRPBCC family protein [Halosolutus gelatinilyticus]|uniref:SRPBCC family protein n=1 Tax=Halosolutus gelatinilyticus TaxID=2931975 RepID=UPI001FF3FCDC|nr:SRPBCC family protein [Halosolutus gelatinilyticus]